MTTSEGMKYAMKYIDLPDAGCVTYSVRSLALGGQDGKTCVDTFAEMIRSTSNT